jgi:dipeptide/tripeptide permease
MVLALTLLLAVAVAAMFYPMPPLETRTRASVVAIVALFALAFVIWVQRSPGF